MNPCRVLSLYTFGSSGLSTSVLGYFNKVQDDPKKQAPALIRPRFLVFGLNEMKLWS